MTGATVAIEIPEAVSDLDEGRAMGACEAVLGDDRCGPLDQGFSASFIARVTQPSALELTIELTQTGQDEVAALRVLRFTEEEPEAFRWQSAGVVVAALVLSQTPSQAPSPSAPEPAPAEPGPQKADSPKGGLTSPDGLDDSGNAPAPTNVTEPDVATIDIGPLVASTASGIGVAVGASLGGALRVNGPLHVVASGEASTSSADDATVAVRSRSLGGSLGLAFRGSLAHPRFGWELSARGAFQNLRVSATSDTESGDAATSRWGGRVGGSLAWLPSRFVGVVVAGDAGLVWPPIDVEVGRGEPLRIPALIWSGYVGLRIRLNRL